MQRQFDWDVTGLIAGVDEAGRGPLAGPVFAAAVILDDRKPIRGLKDSKLLLNIIMTINQYRWPRIIHDFFSIHQWVTFRRTNFNIVKSNRN